MHPVNKNDFKDCYFVKQGDELSLNLIKAGKIWWRDGRQRSMKNLGLKVAFFSGGGKQTMEEA